MKAKLIIISWLLSIVFLFTDSLIQALVALCWLAISSLLLEKYKKEAIDEVNKFNNWIDKQINK